MNKHLHRIIFNKSRGERMVVAETAAAQGGSAAGETARGTPQARTSGPLSACTAAVSMFALAILVLCAPSHAQIKADPAASGHQRPVILAAPNGVPVVNITTPSAAGISRNVYSQMDVARPGAVLNNSRTNLQSRLGGFIQGNPFLATGSAKAILNEVNSANPTLLRGPIEVAGQRADVIIANPSGIKVDGATFINASHVVLSTGTPQLSSQGSLESYRVVKGTFVVEGLGLDTRTATTTEILARAAEINAGLWANYLKMTLGANDVNAADPSNPTPITPPADIPKPRFMLDVAAIGGMYAGHIFLVGSESGLGVSNHGIIGAAEAGNVVLLADGTLTNRGSIQAAAQVQLNAAGGISNSGTIQAGGNAGLATQGTISNEGAQARIAAQSDISLSAGTGGISNTGGATVWAGTALSLGSTGALQNTQGTLAAHGAVSITAASVRNDAGTIASVNDRVSLSATGALSNAGGAISAGSAASLAASQVNNDKGYIGTVNNLSLNAASLTGQGSLLSHGDIALNLQGPYTHTGELTALGNATLAVTGDLTNNALLQAGKTLTVSAGTFSFACTQTATIPMLFTGCGVKKSVIPL